MREKFGRFYGVEIATLANHEIQFVSRLTLDIINSAAMNSKDNGRVKGLLKAIDREAASRPVVHSIIPGRRTTYREPRYETPVE